MGEGGGGAELGRVCGGEEGKGRDDRSVLVAKGGWIGCLWPPEADSSRSRWALGRRFISCGLRAPALLSGLWAEAVSISPLGWQASALFLAMLSPSPPASIPLGRRCRS